MYLGCRLLQKPVEFSAGIMNLQKHIEQLTFKDLPTEERVENLFYWGQHKREAGNKLIAWTVWNITCKISCSRKGHCKT